MPDEIRQSPEALFDGRGRIETVQLVQIEVIQLHAGEACSGAVHDVGPRRAALIGLRTDLTEDFGRDDDFIARYAQILQALARDPFGIAVRIHVGRVDEVDPGFEGTSEQGVGFGLLDRADAAPDSAAAEGHRTEAQFRDEEPGRP